MDLRRSLIVSADLRAPPHRVLYGQACQRRIINESEANFLNFIAAAVRAKSIKEGDPVKVFMGIVRNNLWMNITQAEEERARDAIRKHQGL